MKLRTAISKLQYSFNHNTILLTKEDKEALNLGSKAMEYIERSRCFGKYPVCRQLPGETKE